MDVREKLVEILKQAPFEGKVLDEWWWEEKIKRIADHLISNGVTVQEWIPVTEMLPSIDETILVYDGDVDTGIFYKGAFQTFDENGYPFEISGVTHWMPLPEPPKGE